MDTVLKIGTRGSPLALAQAKITRELLIASGLVAEDGIETVIIKTGGDRIQDRSLADIGGKGLFTKEIEEALSDGRIDLAVHSLKDLPAWMPDGLGLGAVLKRADPRDALLSSVANSVDSLPPGARIGTSSPRRRALLLNRRPDLTIVDFRGNVGTRLDKLAKGEVDGTLLAVAGIARLGLHVAHYPIDPAEMLPAACQGAIGLEIRLNDARAQMLCHTIGDEVSAIAIAAERAFLAALDGSCRTPIAALATVDGDQVALEALVARPDGTAVIRISERAGIADAARLGDAAGHRVKTDMPLDFFVAAEVGAGAAGR
ncbi:MAG: porphobilinogen deaminase [Rhodospirillales bacterium]|nr:porphobilinogen deaminase [Rhodospirillales bacterium]